MFVAKVAFNLATLWVFETDMLGEFAFEYPRFMLEVDIVLNLVDERLLFLFNIGIHNRDKNK